MTRQDYIQQEADKERSQAERDAFMRGVWVAENANDIIVSTAEQVFDNAERAGFTKAMLQDKSRKQPLCLARIAVAYKLKQLGLSSTLVGATLHRDHSSVLYMWDKAEQWFEEPRRHKRELAFVRCVLNGRETYHKT